MCKKFIFLFSFIFFFVFHLADASIIINEIMYDLEGTDAGREWIEIYNNGDNSVDLSSYKLFEANTNHSLTLIQGSKDLPSSDYAVIVSDEIKFKNDWPNFSGTIFDSSFSLSNMGELLSLKDNNLNIIDSYTYDSSQGAMGDGNSLQKISDLWIADIPTPGTDNNNSSGKSNSSDSNNSLTETSNLSINRKITTKIMAQEPIFVKIPTEFNLETTGYYGESLIYGNYFLNFGDGFSQKILTKNNQKITHTYFYPGEYTVTLEYYLNYNSSIPKASDQISVIVIPADIYISKTGDEKDFFVELTNNSSYYVDISNWVLSGNDKNFIFPKNTILSPKNKIIFSPEITKFSIDDKNKLSLLNEDKQIVFIYPSAKSVLNHQKRKRISKINSNNPIYYKNKSLPKINSSIPILSNSNVTETVNNDLSAMVLNSNLLNSYTKNNNTLKDINLDTKNFTEKNKKEKKISDFLIITSLIILILTGVISVYFIRRKNLSGLIDDFEIIDE